MDPRLRRLPDRDRRDFPHTTTLPHTSVPVGGIVVCRPMVLCGRGGMPAEPAGERREELWPLVRHSTAR